MFRDQMYREGPVQHHDETGYFIVGIIFTLFLVAVLLGILALLRKDNTQQNSAQTDTSQIVRERYARGEIKKDEYDQLLADLAPTTTKSKK